MGFLSQLYLDWNSYIHWWNTLASRRDKLGFGVLVPVIFLGAVLIGLLGHVIPYAVAFALLLQILVNMFVVVPWVLEKDNIKRFRDIPLENIRHLLKTRIASWVILVFCSELVVIVLAMISSFIQYHDWLPLTLTGMVMFIGSSLFFNIFQTLLATWASIKKGNYLRFMLPQLVRKCPPNVSAYDFKKLKLLRISYIREVGWIYSSILFFAFFVAYFGVLIIVYGEQESLLSHSSLVLQHVFFPIILPYILICNLLFIISSIYLWKKLPNTLQNVPAYSYTLPIELSVALNACTLNEPSSKKQQ